MRIPCTPVTCFRGYAETARVAAHAAVRIADEIDFATAAAVPVNYLTAYLALIHCGSVRAGETVLIHGGAGGVGLAALDLGRPLDITLLATAGSDDKCRRLEGMGVTKAINYRTTDYEQAVRETRRGLEGLRDRLESGEIKPVIDATLPLTPKG